ncbi:MAG: phosphatidylserine decarboxylase family protein [Flavobacteriales bacterium]|uniref:phosphatidylserine decarboxylase family protein n=1 Tax=Blattabacterium sp. (Mastotermes darwiniensis) TaxID=39768 RepID=UPI00059B4471|nr:phosphatidylserine decarboxylase family protein [Blattabacterium sp. (Mastotermes darwiniensis)]MDR1804781.1 phosphatidylserine decarboxylase family protein [Flavobacteriales bacterium]
MIHKEGFSFLICSLIFVLISFFISIFLFSILINLFISFFLITLYSFFLFFFRNPKRNFSYNENEVISPADGKILEIKSVFENEYLKKDCICISIFMSPFNVHVNRFPVSGIITYVRYHPGKYWFAWNKKASFQNERTTTVVETKEKQKILFRQIAGFLARRIIIYAKKNFLAKKGEEFGFIKFGSRVDIYLPLKSIIIIKKGEKVIGGKTIISIIQ